MLPCMPVTWKNGNTASVDWLGSGPNQCTPATSVYITVRCVCMHPLGRPVVPEV